MGAILCLGFRWQRGVHSTNAFEIGATTPGAFFERNDDQALDRPIRVLTTPQESACNGLAVYTPCSQPTLPAGFGLPKSFAGPEAVR